MSKPFVQTEREAFPLLAHYPDEYVEPDALPHFVRDCLERIDLSEIESLYSDRGRKAYPPRALLGAWILAYLCGVSSSRGLEQACRRDLWFHVVTGGLRPDHDTLNRFRQRCTPAMERIFLQVLEQAGRSGATDLSAVCLDGTKMKANASLSRNGDADSAHRGLSLATTLRDCIDDIEANCGIAPEERAVMERKAEVLELRGRKVLKELRRRPGKGKGSSSSTKVNTTDPDSRIMRTAKGNFQQSYNAQAGVDPDSMLIVTQDVSDAANDMREVEPTLEAMARLPESLGEPTALVADAGYCSESNLEECEKAGVTPYIAPGRKLPDASAKPGKSSKRGKRKRQKKRGGEAARRNAQRLSEPDGRDVYARRGSSVETVFGIVRNVMGFNSFRLRGRTKVRMEWTLVCLAWNVKRLHRLRAPL